MQLTLGQAIPRLAQYCGTGKSPDNPTVVDDINEAIERLMNKPKLWAGTTQSLILCAPNGQITLPREVAKIIKCRVNGRFREVQSRWFEYYSNGNGLLGKGNWCGPLVDRGFACTQYDIPQGVPMYISIVSDREEDDNAKILLRGHDETGREVYGLHSFGESVPIYGGAQDTMWVSEKLFSDITAIEKPITRGYVYVSAILPSLGIRYFLGSIHPDETHPQYRRYFVQEVARDVTTTTTPLVNPDPLTTVQQMTPYRLDAMCKLQYVPLVHDSDPLLIQNFGALKMMLKAVRLEDAEQFDAAMKCEATAERILGEQTQNLENDETVIETDQSFFNSSGMIEVV